MTKVIKTKFIQVRLRPDTYTNLREYARLKEWSISTAARYLIGMGLVERLRETK